MFKSQTMLFEAFVVLAETMFDAFALRPCAFFVLRVISFLLITFMRLFVPCVETEVSCLAY